MALCIKPRDATPGSQGRRVALPKVNQRRCQQPIPTKFTFESVLKSLQARNTSPHENQSTVSWNLEPQLSGVYSTAQGQVPKIGWADSKASPADIRFRSAPTSRTGNAASESCVDRAYEEPAPPSRRGKRDSSSRKATRSNTHNTSSQLVPARNQRGHGAVFPNGNNRDEDEDDEDGGDDGERGSCTSDSGKKQKYHLACPYYKYDGMRYMSCARLRLKRIRDVKQHLSRRHRRPMYCPACGEVFTDSGHWHAHISARTCDRVDGVEIHGVTQTQVLALARRVNRSLDPTKQWLSIWSILFPDAKPPVSPYMANKFEETIGMVRDYWKRHGQDLVKELAGPASGRSSRSSGGVNNITALTSRVVDTLLERFQSSSRAAMDPAASNPLALESPPRLPSVPINLVTALEPSPPLTPSWQFQQLELPQQGGRVGASNPVYGAISPPTRDLGLASHCSVEMPPRNPDDAEISLGFDGSFLAPQDTISRHRGSTWQSLSAQAEWEEPASTTNDLHLARFETEPTWAFTGAQFPTQLHPYKLLPIYEANPDIGGIDDTNDILVHFGATSSSNIA